MVEASGRGKAGFEKIKFCSEQAARDGLQYFWVDSCCNKKSNDAELSESIIPVFRWYQGAEKCYVYLSDVSTRKRKRRGDATQDAWKQAFGRVGGSLEAGLFKELLAPNSVVFSKEGKPLGDKQSLKQQIHEVTGIPILALRLSALSQFGTNQKLDWAKNRRTTREED